MFQSALAPKDERYRPISSNLPPTYKVSIRSAPKDERYWTAQELSCDLEWFQSALAPKDERYIISLHVIHKVLSCFNPLSPRRTRDTHDLARHVVGDVVSIRSRPEGREIQRDPVLFDRLLKFQSALAPKDERYMFRSVHLRLTPGFNPLSPRRTRDTSSPSDTEGSTPTFQSALAPKDERYRRSGSRRSPSWRFNPALAPKDERYLKLSSQMRNGGRFQSALAPKDERYWGIPTLTGLKNVSIRSRPEGREIPVLYPARFLSTCSFNPLSPRRTRDTH